MKLGRRWGVPRCLQIADIVLPKTRITVMNTHLGLDPLERLRQMNRIAALCSASWGRTSRAFCAATSTPCATALRSRIWGSLFDYRSSSRTFPARRPALQLDRIFAAGLGRCVNEGILRDDRFREASDHLPVYANFEIDA